MTLTRLICRSLFSFRGRSPIVFKRWRASLSTLLSIMRLDRDDTRRVRAPRFTTAHISLSKALAYRVITRINDRRLVIRADEIPAITSQPVSRRSIEYRNRVRQPIGKHACRLTGLFTLRQWKGSNEIAIKPKLWASRGRRVERSRREGVPAIMPPFYNSARGGWLVV